MKKRRVIIILGMHRSGTSLITGYLETKWGVFRAKEIISITYYSTINNALLNNKSPLCQNPLYNGLSTI